MPERDPFLARGAYADAGRYDGQPTALPASARSLPGAYAEEEGGFMSSLPASLRGLAENMHNDDWKAGHEALLPGQGKQRKGLRFHAQSVATMVLLPWMAFVLVCVTVGVFLSQTPTAATCVVSFCVAVSVLFMYLHFFFIQGGGPMYLYLGILGLLAVSSGWTAGKSVNESDMAQFWAQQNLAAVNNTYAAIAPTSRAASLPDAFVIQFTENTRLDLRRVMGHVAADGTTYCVAPILDETQLTEVEFWAAGTNCCESRRSFKCSDALNPTARTGVVISDRGTTYNIERHKQFITAANQAASFYSLHTPETPIFVRWATDANTGHTEHLHDGVLSLVGWCFLYLVVSIFIAVVLHWSNSK